MFKEARENLRELNLTNTEQYAECLSKLARAYAYDHPLDECNALSKEAQEIVDKIEGNTLVKLTVVNDRAGECYLSYNQFFWSVSLFFCTCVFLCLPVLSPVSVCVVCLLV